MYQQTKNNRNSWNLKSSKWKPRKEAVKPVHRYARFVQKCKEEDKKCEDYWASVIPILQKAQEELKSLGKPPYYKFTKENILYCIKIFSIASTCQDKLNGALHILPYEKREIGKRFNNDLYYTGRHEKEDLRNDSSRGNVPYWNTTSKGDPITVDNICFGPDIGLPRKPASYWLKLSKNKKVFVEEQTIYEKGTLAKTVAIWTTDALVRTGINHFIRIAYQSLSEDLEELLS